MPLVITGQGVAMLSNVINSKLAIKEEICMFCHAFMSKSDNY
jgi:hypothetical protein